jgi:hypothetical protein
VYLVWPFFGAGGADEVVATLAGRARRIVYLSAEAARPVHWEELSREEAEQRTTGVPDTALDEWARDHVEDLR